MSQFSFLYKIFISGALSLALVACGDKNDEPSYGKEDIPNEDNTGNSEQTPSSGNQASDFKFPLAFVKLPDNTSSQIKEYTGFTVSFNKENHTPNYVSWELLDSETYGNEDRNDYPYWVDYDLEGCLSIDFAYSTYGYDRGHLCPAADQKWSASAMNDCMVMTNMVPQVHAFNAGMWETLEEKERKWAKRDKAIWIIAGPVYYDFDQLFIGKAQARVPSACFKAFLYLNGDDSRAIAFVLTNGSNPGDLSRYAMSIDKLEEDIGYDLFSELPDELETRIEASFNFNDWN